MSTAAEAWLEFLLAAEDAAVADLWVAADEWEAVTYEFVAAALAPLPEPVRDQQLIAFSEARRAAVPAFHRALEALVKVRDLKLAVEQARAAVAIGGAE